MSDRDPVDDIIDRHNSAAAHAATSAAVEERRAGEGKAPPVDLSTLSTPARGPAPDTSSFMRLVPGSNNIRRAAWDEGDPPRPIPLPPVAAMAQHIQHVATAYGQHHVGSDVLLLVPGAEPEWTSLSPEPRCYIHSSNNRRFLLVRHEVEIPISHQLLVFYAE